MSFVRGNMLARRLFSTARTLRMSEGVHPKYHQVKKLQADFQKDSGLLIHQRGGMFDKALYGLTCLIGLAILEESLRNIYIMAMKGR